MARVWTVFRAAIRWICLLSVLVLALLVITRVWVLNSEPYAVAERFLLSNLCLRREVGAVRGVKLAYFGPYEMSNGAIKGEATFTVSVRGERSDAIVMLTLVKDLGEWSVSRAMIKDERSADSSDELTKCHES